MTIEEAINNDYCIEVANKDELRILSSHFRGELKIDDEKWNFPLYCYAPYSMTRGRLGLGFNSGTTWQNRQLIVINAGELEISI